MFSKKTHIFKKIYIGGTIFCPYFSMDQKLRFQNISYKKYHK